MAASRWRWSSASRKAWAFLPFSSPDLLRRSNIPKLERRAVGELILWWDVRGKRIRDRFKSAKGAFEAGFAHEEQTNGTGGTGKRSPLEPRAGALLCRRRARTRNVVLLPRGRMSRVFIWHTVVFDPDDGGWRETLVLEAPLLMVQLSVAKRNGVGRSDK